MRSGCERRHAGLVRRMEAELQRQMLELARDLTKEIMAAYDVDAPAVAIAGIAHRRVLRAEQTYMPSAGLVMVERWLYRGARADGRPSWLSSGARTAARARHGRQLPLDDP